MYFAGGIVIGLIAGFIFGMILMFRSLRTVPGVITAMNKHGRTFFRKSIGSLD